MKPAILIPLLAGLMLAITPLAAQDGKKAAPSPGEIVSAAQASDWVDIAPEDLLVITLAPDAKGRPRRVILQLMPAPFGQGWIANMRALARAHWWDGLTVYRAQDNYVVQWGDADSDDPKKAKKLPDGLRTMPESDYAPAAVTAPPIRDPKLGWVNAIEDAYGFSQFWHGWPLGRKGILPAGQDRNWPVHCYGMVGVGRDMSPDTGTGAELYAVIGHAPRHLDRNIALVGRVIEGIENFSTLPRGTGNLGFYEDAAERVPIVSVRLASELPAAEQPHFQYLSTESASFARYADARANRRDPFFIVPAGGADICNIPVPIRRRP